MVQLFRRWKGVNPEPGPLTGTRCGLKSQSVTVQQMFIRGRGCLSFAALLTGLLLAVRSLPSGSAVETSGGVNSGEREVAPASTCPGVLTSSGGSLPLFQ